MIWCLLPRLFNSIRPYQLDNRFRSVVVITLESRSWIPGFESHLRNMFCSFIKHFKYTLWIICILFFRMDYDLLTCIHFLIYKNEFVYVINVVFFMYVCVCLCVCVSKCVCFSRCVFFWNIIRGKGIWRKPCSSD